MERWYRDQELSYLHDALPSRYINLARTPTLVMETCRIPPVEFSPLSEEFQPQAGDENILN